MLVKLIIRTEFKPAVAASRDNSCRTAFNGEGGVIVFRFDVRIVVPLECGLIAERTIIVRDLVWRVVRLGGLISIRVIGSRFVEHVGIRRSYVTGDVFRRCFTSKVRSVPGLTLRLRRAIL